jgi:hypothetical protein
MTMKAAFTPFAAMCVLIRSQFIRRRAPKKNAKAGRLGKWKSAAISMLTDLISES